MKSLLLIFFVLLAALPALAQGNSTGDKQRAQSLSHSDAGKQGAQGSGDSDATKQRAQSFSHADPGTDSGATKQR